SPGDQPDRQAAARAARLTRLAFACEGRYCCAPGGRNMGNKVRKLSLGLAIAALAFAEAAPAQPFPSHPVTLIVPFGAGGPVDTLARSLSNAISASLGQPIIIENVTGASGTIGVGRAVRAAPDGYTVSIGNWPSHVVNGAIYTLPYDVLKDFEPVARLPS